MNQQNDGKGRPLEQQTRDGTSSVGSVGPGGTGSAGQESFGRSQQAAGRTVDLLSSGMEEEDSGYLHGGSADLQTGLGGIGSMSRSGNPVERRAGGQGGSMQSAADNQGSASIPDTGGQRPENQQSGAMNQQGLDGERLADMDRDPGNLSREEPQNRQSGRGEEGARDSSQGNPAGQRGDPSP